MSHHTSEEIISDFAEGKLVVLMDDESRENEGDLIMPAEKATPKAINFMARYGRGLICMPLTRERCAQLGLKLMVTDNREAHRTQFTTSIDAASGVTTGISAADRAATILAAVHPDARPSDLVQPGHVFPLMAEPGGVLTRAGHTEAGCDLVRLAGHEPAAMIVEILNEDGSMARRDDLLRFAHRHSLKIGTIADLISYRLAKEETVEAIAELQVQTEFGPFRLVCMEDHINRTVHLALVKGTPKARTPTLVRVHVQDTLSDVVGIQDSRLGWPLRSTIKLIAEEGCGVIVILRRGEEPRDLMKVVRELEHGHSDKVVAHDRTNELKTFGTGAQVLRALGVKRMRVLSAPKQMHAISGFGLEVVEYLSDDDPAA